MNFPSVKENDFLETNISICAKLVYLIAAAITIAGSLVKTFPSRSARVPFNSPVISRDVSQIGTSPTDGDNAPRAGTPTPRVSNGRQRRSVKYSGQR